MSQRLIRVRELLKRELGVILERDFEFQGSLVTITEVDVTPDLKHAFVYVGIIAGSRQPDEILAKLSQRRVAVQSRLGKRLSLKRTPQLEFRGDDSGERAVRLVSLMDQLGLQHQSEPMDPLIDETADFDPDLPDDGDDPEGSDEPPSRRGDQR